MNGIKNNIIASVVIVSMVLGFAGAVQAVFIDHTTLGTLFADNYENQSLGDVPSGSGALPSPQTAGEGGWSGTFSGNGTGTVVTAVGPGAVQGSQFLRVQNDGLAGAGNTATLVMDITDVAQANAGAIVAQWSFYVDSSPTSGQLGSYNATFGSTDSGGFQMANLGFQEDGSVSLSCQGCGAATTGTIPVDQWLTAVLTYNVLTGGGNDSFSLEILSQAIGVGSLFSGTGPAVGGDEGSRNIESFTFGGDNFSFNYFDEAVFLPTPEPTTLTMLGLGGLMLYRRLQRSRRQG